MDSCFKIIVCNDIGRIFSIDIRNCITIIYQRCNNIRKKDLTEKKDFYYTKKLMNRAHLLNGKASSNIFDI